MHKRIEGKENYHSMGTIAHCDARTSKLQLTRLVAFYAIDDRWTLENMCPIFIDVRRQHRRCMTQLKPRLARIDTFDRFIQKISMIDHSWIHVRVKICRHTEKIEITEYRTFYSFEIAHRCAIKYRWCDSSLRTRKATSVSAIEFWTMTAYTCRTRFKVAELATNSFIRIHTNTSTRAHISRGARSRLNHLETAMSRLFKNILRNS